MESFDLIPIDTLFFRDARPLAAGSAYGRGARWPLPPALHSALRTALLSKAGTLPAAYRPGALRRGVPRGRMGSDAFQWLHIHGPFPVLGKKTYFPRPADLVVDQGKAGFLFPVRPINRENDLLPGENNLPRPLLYACARAKAAKEEHPVQWIEHASFEKYLADKPFDLPGEEELWDSEKRIGVSIDPGRQTAREGQLYVAEHLRLRDGARLRFAVNVPPAHKERHPEEDGLLVNDLAESTICFGGEGRFVRVRKAPSPLQLPRIDLAGQRVKWVLLTPAVFLYGWRPGWVDEAGRVRLRVIDKEARREFRRRRRSDPAWQYNEDEETAPRISARLVAACLGKPEPVSGWALLPRIGNGSEGDGTPGAGSKPTMLAVPAGSVYYFEAENEREAQNLAEALHGRCRSDFLGEKGLGLGVCGSWQLLEASKRHGPESDVAGRQGRSASGEERIS
ncbi:type III-B CRISPR module-associated Cmr3 family protein [Methylacidimicrobium sp. B4]|uniref:type III-B CRISPR module-associated Cmr3 family protein n=1 Tax=Methylacidimicrobium sp. B4 TaxID=2796139 RepID=UPI001A8C2A39|nr:type III-B CRISPR module-associated Cmr3 family protein [Methylacidimicrobium sp. B4]QSR84637.1 hypothetical protein MacB4_10670 [Methylacidimicrobium sp. B4]